LIFVMVKCGVLFEVRTKFLNIIQTSVGIKGFVNQSSIFIGHHIKFPIKLTIGLFLDIRRCVYNLLLLPLSSTSSSFRKYRLDVKSAENI
jgi:hypothetical protein